MAFSYTYSLSAPPEVVFNSLTDPDRTARWLPAGVSLEMRDAERMVVQVGGHRLELQIHTDMQRMRMTGQLAGRSEVRGGVQVTQAPAGGCNLAVEWDGLDHSRAHRLVDDAVEQLRRDVSDNFNAG